MSILSVNEAIAQVAQLSGTVVKIYGSLSLDFEGRRIDHIPKSERSAGFSDDLKYWSSIWVEFDLSAIGQPELWLQQFDTRHVLVSGVLWAPDAEIGGCGHMSMWPAQLDITSVQKK